MSHKTTASLFLIATAVPALAQTADVPVVRSLSPVVISVTRGVEQRAFDTPASVDVIDASTIRNGGLQVNLSESLARVPGIVALNRQNYAQDIQISSRGFGARSTFGVRGLRAGLLRHRPVGLRPATRHGQASGRRQALSATALRAGHRRAGVSF